MTTEQDPFVNAQAHAAGPQPFVGDADADAAWPVALFMSTPLVVSVQVRLEGPAHTEHQALVIARQHCVGNRPRLRALLDGLSAMCKRLKEQRRARELPHRILVCVAGRWIPVLPLAGCAAA